MEQCTATIRHYGDNLFENLAVRLDDCSTDKNRNHWFGDFTLPPHATIEQRGVFRLIIQDGREGDILLDTQSVDSDSPSVIRFHGCSPLV